VGRVAAQRYQLTRELGRGGMGVVYLATDTVLQREVALKELPLHLGGATDLSKRFRQEARVLAKLSHPCIVQVFDLVEDEGRLWIALEFVRGGTLADAMRYAGGALAWPEVARIGRQVAEGLAFAHAQGVIHRDIKPMNVLVTDARPPLAKLTDFGLARLVESTEHTQPGSLLGSARYMSPEQVAGRPADARSDLYALGVTLFEMLTGRVPFEGEFAAVLARHASETPPDVRTLAPDVPQALAELVASLLAKAPEDRPRDAALVARDLEAFASGGGEERLAA
jgi:serine/threonine-protein kinase